MVGGTGPFASGFNGEKEAEGEKWKATGLQQLDRNFLPGQNRAHFLPSSPPLTLHAPSTFADSTYPSPVHTGDHIPASSFPDETEQRLWGLSGSGHQTRAAQSTTTHCPI